MYLLKILGVGENLMKAGTPAGVVADALWSSAHVSPV